jgi:hypothetical protein
MKFAVKTFFGIRELECDNISLFFGMCFQNLPQRLSTSSSSTFHIRPYGLFSITTNMELWILYLWADSSVPWTGQHEHLDGSTRTRQYKHRRNANRHEYTEWGRTHDLGFSYHRHHCNCVRQRLHSKCRNVNRKETGILRLQLRQKKKTLLIPLRNESVRMP